MKYKVGDKVRVIKRMCGHEFTIGEIVEIIHATPYDYRAINTDRKTWWVTSGEVEPVDTHKIVITTDGTTTLARLYENNNVVKTAEAKCNPEDTFDFQTGAEIAFNRLIGKPVGQAVKYNIGDRIFAEDNIGKYPGGAWGTVVKVLDKRIHKEDYMVKFDKGGELCSHVVPVPTTPKSKYPDGKYVCIEHKRK